MTLTLPIPLASFWDAIPLEQGSVFEPDEAMEVNRTGGGTILPSALGHRLWRGEVTFGLASQAERGKAAAVLNRLRQPGQPFLCHDRKRAYPLHDPDGSLLGAAAVTVRSAGTSDLNVINLEGFPADYRLAPGDLIGYQLGTAPVLHFLHEVLEDVEANAGGVTGAFEIAPFRLFAVPTGTAVKVIRPTMTAIYDPGSFRPGRGRSGGWEQGRSFAFRQTLEY